MCAFQSSPLLPVRLLSLYLHLHLHLSLSLLSLPSLTALLSSAGNNAEWAVVLRLSYGYIMFVFYWRFCGNRKTHLISVCCCIVAKLRRRRFTPTDHAYIMCMEQPFVFVLRLYCDRVLNHCAGACGTLTTVIMVMNLMQKAFLSSPGHQGTA